MIYLPLGNVGENIRHVQFSLTQKEKSVLEKDGMKL